MAKTCKQQPGELGAIAAAVDYQSGELGAIAAAVDYQSGNKVARKYSRMPDTAWVAFLTSPVVGYSSAYATAYVAKYRELASVAA